MKYLALIFLTLITIGCGTDEVKFHEMTRIEQIDNKEFEPEPETEELCQYDEEGNETKRIEFESEGLIFWKENYNFQECEDDGSSESWPSSSSSYSKKMKERMEKRIEEYKKRAQRGG